MRGNAPSPAPALFLLPAEPAALLSLAKTGNSVVMPSGGGTGTELSFRCLLQSPSVPPALESCRQWEEGRSRGGHAQPSTICLWAQQRSRSLAALSYESRVTSQGAALGHRAGHPAMATALRLQSLGLLLSLSSSEVGLCYPSYLPHFLLFKAHLRQELPVPEDS